MVEQSWKPFLLQGREATFRSARCNYVVRCRPGRKKVSLARIDQGKTMDRLRGSLLVRNRMTTGSCIADCTALVQPELNIRSLLQVFADGITNECRIL